MRRHSARMNKQYRNKLLQNLPPDAVGRLGLRPLALDLNHELEFPGKPIRHVFFIEQGVGSMTNTFQDGSQVEVGLFGFESAIGVSALMGTKRSLNRVYMQVAGHGYQCSLEAAAAEFKRGAEFQHLALRYVQAQLTQATQTAGCNAKHSLEQRLARWLSLCADRLESNTVGIPHIFLADMLGVTRSTVAIAAYKLREQGLIEYERVQIRIPDREALRGAACECYRVVRDHLDNYVEFDTGFGA